jgi:signal transduction histidine kinase/CheY-like chemotaxis protein/HPt (histidine-containing phosphotransfer) domain-containing protein
MFRRIKEYFSSGKQNLTKVYLYALTSIALLALAFNAIKFSLYSEQSSAIQAIREVERQTIRSDRLYSRLLDLQLSSGWKSRKQSLIEAQDSAADFFQAREKIDGLKAFHNFCENRDCSSRNFANLNELRKPSFKVTADWTEKSLVEIKSYRALLERLNQFLDASTNKVNSNLIILDISFLGCLLFFLLFQAVFIFKPSVAKLDHALSVRSEFLSRISHEIRNPMNAVLGMAEVLKGTRLNLEQRQYVDSLLRAGQALLEMLNNLIDVSAVEGKKVELRSSSFNLFEVIDKISQVVAPGAHHKGIEFFVRVDPKIPPQCRADVGRLEQVLINLLNNAVKFTSKGYVLLGVDLVATEENKSHVVISVSDTGIGIDKNKTQDIFNSFVQEDSSIKRQYGGSGLGLTISSEILQMMGSRLKVESEKGTGSRFYFELDLDHDRLSSEEQAQESMDPLPIIFFTSQFEDVMDSILKRATRTHWVCTTEEAVFDLVEKLKAPVHVIVDDSVGIVNMVAISEALKTNPRVKILSSLLKTSFPKENIDLIRKSGSSHFLRKPFRSWLLAEADKNQIPFTIEETEDNAPSQQRRKFNLKVLVVDDSEDNLFLLREILNPLVTKIDFASNGQEAIEEVEKNSYDIIFMDIQMPVMDGYTAIRRIRKLDMKNIPVIAVTAHGGVIDEKRCLEAGFSARLVKPISTDQIVNTLDHFYGSRPTPTKEDQMATIDPMILKLLPTFFSTRDKDLSFMEEALRGKDFDQIKALAHKMKGSSLSYGFEEIGNKVKRLETAALEKDLDLCQKLYHEVYNDLEEEKKKYSQSLA